MQSTLIVCPSPHTHSLTHPLTHSLTYSITHSLTLTACPQGLEWDGKSCDIVIDSGDINEETSVSDWSISTTRYWTLIFMFLASLVVLLISLVVKSSKIASSKRSLTLNSCKQQSGKHHQLKENTSLSRVEDLLPPS